MSASVASRERRRRDRQGYLGCGGIGGVVGGANPRYEVGVHQLHLRCWTGVRSIVRMQPPGKRFFMRRAASAPRHPIHRQTNEFS